MDSENRYEDHQINHEALTYLPDSDERLKQYVFLTENNKESAGYLHISIDIDEKKMQLEHIYILQKHRSKLLSYTLIDSALEKLRKIEVKIESVHTTRTTPGGEKCFEYLKENLLKTKKYTS
ncbi:GNAT family N-acetyltransferase [Pseudoalteromonas marina]|uniref:N-acetyltransferase domain-containing protein n=1 Tax=Pseudoalteromonas marina TaxID=267375 RepID=A0ABT9FGS3_9GAMM|nr:GNAT family N-acetyltransferase [Pseudoalteromonas marina]MDP2565820.1 hypothetical protein [Pseudoalteromonas marina]